jgi:hypothetical protein
MTTTDQPDSSALSLLNNLHPPIIAIFYCGLYVFRGETSLGIRRRRITLQLMLLLDFSYLAEALYYAYLPFSETEQAPRYVIFHVLGAILV